MCLVITVGWAFWGSRPKSNSELFMDYGFAVPGNKNDFLDDIFSERLYYGEFDKIIRSILKEIICHWKSLVSLGPSFRTLRAMLKARP